MNLDTKKVNIYLNELFSSENEPQNIENYINLFSILEKENYDYYTHFLNIENFNLYVTEILNKKIINVYSNEKTDKDYQIDKNYFSKNKILFIYNYLHEKDFDKKILLLNKINKCFLYPKHKKNDVSEPENYRFLTDHTQELKLLDKIYIDVLLNIVPKNFINQDIFKASLINNNKNFENNIESCCTIASNNTENLENVALLDVSKAFDSVEWDLLYKNMTSILSQYISHDIAFAITNEYFILLQNRNTYYRKDIKSKRKYKIDVKKSISQGLPSSNVIFTIFLLSIITKWKNESYYNIDDYLILNIYIDDFYIKFKKICKINQVFVEKLIKELKENKLYVNNDKSLADNNLGLEFKKLKNSDFYLGIPFTRDIQLYKEFILQDYKEKHYKKIKQFNVKCNWNEFYRIITNNSNNSFKKHLLGYFKYKLKPLIYHHQNITQSIKCTDNIIIQFIKDNL